MEPLRCIRNERYKLVMRHHESGPIIRQVGQSSLAAERYGFYDRRLGRIELFDLYLDPWEHCNRAEEDFYSGIRQELEDTLRQWMEETMDPFACPHFTE